MYYKCDLRDHVLSPEFFGTKFDVILVDPPWEEYVHRALGITDHIEYWTFDEIMNLKIELILPLLSSFGLVMMWVLSKAGHANRSGDLVDVRIYAGLRVKTNKKNAGGVSLRHDSHTFFSAFQGSTKKPEHMYQIIEHFALGKRRLELFGEDHNIRPSWLTLGKGLSSSNYNKEAHIKNFSDKDGKVWQGGGGRNPPPEAAHLVVTTPEIEALQPKSPPQKNQ
ncbi:N6-adenosine-methyltransferase subunit METTL14 [Rhynchospora pubera]|uniref:N6-adenosine-methyltransferase subunit METTL14 n=1 Tax=Rhynchospora pubera TaxID=906938 RepID=A0AAV8GQG4_9POAL|nr:N6-adenosine-methyltransferase subunit METTL14 [Rhynchospora pubera]